MEQTHCFFVNLLLLLMFTGCKISKGHNLAKPNLLPDVSNEGLFLAPTPMAESFSAQGIDLSSLTIGEVGDGTHWFYRLELQSAQVQTFNILVCASRGDACYTTKSIHTRVTLPLINSGLHRVMAQGCRYPESTPDPKKPACQRWSSVDFTPTHYDKKFQDQLLEQLLRSNRIGALSADLFQSLRGLTRTCQSVGASCQLDSGLAQDLTQMVNTLAHFEPEVVAKALTLTEDEVISLLSSEQASGLELTGNEGAEEPLAAVGRMTEKVIATVKKGQPVVDIVTAVTSGVTPKEVTLLGGLAHPSGKFTVKGALWVIGMLASHPVLQTPYTLRSEGLLPKGTFNITPVEFQAIPSPASLAVFREPKVFTFGEGREPPPDFVYPDQPASSEDLAKLSFIADRELQKNQNKTLTAKKPVQEPTAMDKELAKRARLGRQAEVRRMKKMGLRLTAEDPPSGAKLWELANQSARSVPELVRVAGYLYAVKNRVLEQNPQPVALLDILKLYDQIVAEQQAARPNPS